MRINGWDICQSARDRRWYIDSATVRRGPYASRASAEQTARKATNGGLEPHPGFDNEGRPRETREMRFNDGTTIGEFLSAVAPVLQRHIDRDDMTRGQQCFGAACAYAAAYPDSQTARDLLCWAHGSTPERCVENAHAETAEEWIAPEDIAAFDAMPV